MSTSRPHGVRLRSAAGLSVRSLRARPLRSVLTGGAIVLGVGMVFGVLLLVGTVHSTFGRLYDSIYGKADLVISGPQSVGALPIGAIERARATEGVASASGDIGSLFRRVNADGTIDRASNAQVFVAGVDFAQPDPTTAELAAGRKPRSGDEIQLAADWAAQQGIEVGDRLRVSTPSGLATVSVVGLFRFPGGLDLAGYGTASMPIDAARVLMDKPRTWDEINVVVDGGADTDTVAARLKAALGPGVEVVTPEAKTAEVDDQLAGLDIVLYFFSGIALFVGGFLILNSFNMTVLQRMREIGTLRALGATRRRIAGAILAEALVLGAIGSVFGLALGFGLAHLLMRAMQGFGFPVGALDLSAWAAIAAVVTGLLATAAGAARPAMRAARMPPIRALVGTAQARRPPGLRRAVVGLLLFVPGLAIGGTFWFGSANAGGFLAALVGVGSTMVMFAGMVLLAPFVVVPLVQLLAIPVRAVMPAEGRLAGDALRANPTRTAATAATLLVALSVVVVNTTLASSFVHSISDELDRQFARDLTVQPVGYQEFGPPQSTLSQALRDRIEALPEVGAVAGRRVLAVSDLPKGGGQGLLVGYDPGDWARVDSPVFVGASKADALRGLARGGVVPGRTYADKVGLKVGDRVTLRGPSGGATVPVVALLDSFEAGGATMQMSAATIARIYGVRNDAQLAVKARRPDDRQALERRVNVLLERDYPSFEARSNAQIKADTKRQIDQQFAFFNAIVGVAVLIGMLGIINTLSMSVLERTREIGVLRALGGSRWRVRMTMADESVLLSVAGALAGMLAGVIVAIVWIIALRASTLPGLALRFPVGTLAIVAVLGVVIGVLASIVPARRAARLDPLQALRYE